MIKLSRFGYSIIIHDDLLVNFYITAIKVGDYFVIHSMKKDCFK